MAKTSFSFWEYNFCGSWDELSSTSKSSESVDGVNMGKIDKVYGTENWGDAGGIDYGFYQTDSMEEGLLFCEYHQQQKPESYLDYELFDDRRFEIISPTLQTSLEEIAKLDEISSGIQVISESKKKNQQDFSFASLELLKKYDHGRLNGGRIVQPSSDAPYTNLAGQELSTEEIIRIAGARFIQSNCQVVDIASMLNNPFGLSFSNLSDEEAKNVELVELLLASAEKFNEWFTIFSEALRERIDLGTGRISSGFGKQSSVLNQEMTILNPATLACHERIPFFQVARFTGIQAIIDNVAGAKRIHVIDLQIRSGAQWAVLMQALVSRHDCLLELLKISAIGTTSKTVD
ncbi:hypothetical protein GH714_039826 [Hevea brasiliensis]|uniref:Uncharacterized protein n=1 Tax=Hevea brasiliensis TaxID=3981 RepID=A0A6A6MJP2_HEVBR|nr:hypothetical protein GH714_039826 [Hevea brasiliensis]